MTKDNMVKIMVIITGFAILFVLSGPDHRKVNNSIPSPPPIIEKEPVLSTLVNLPSRYKYLESRYFTLTGSAHLGVSIGTLLLEVHAKDEKDNLWLLIYRNEELVCKTRIMETK